MNKILTSTFKRLKGEPNLKEGTVYSILIIISVSHFLNDMIQSVVPAIYPIIKTKFGLSFAQIGIITLVFQMSSSILQPLTGLYSDRHPRPYALSIGMCFTLAGIIILAFAGHFLLLLLAVCTIGLGSSIFHPEASRVAQLASGGRKSLAQSISKLAATEVLQSAHFSQQPSYSPSDKKPSVGLPLLQWRPLPSWCALAAGTACACLMPQGNQNK